MKSKILLILSALTLTLFTTVQFESQKVENYQKQLLLTKNIDLSNTSTNEVRSYYSDLNSLNASERKGENLLKNLYPILEEGSAMTSYAGVWDWGRIVERDFELSPMTPSQAANWNSTNDDPYVRLLYRNDLGSSSGPKNSTTHGQIIDREHVWAKSHGFEEGGPFDSGPAFSDVHHLIYGDSRNNQDGHNNRFFGEVPQSAPEYTVIGNNTYNTTGFRGKVTYKGATETLYEPQDSDKGNIARALFYMTARYAYNRTDHSNTDEPYLKLIDSIVGGGVSGYTSSQSNPGTHGGLHFLLKWHKEDPVDDYEVRRNNLIYNNFQYNRNPFIDYPSWVDNVFGTYNGTTIVAPTTSADPLVDAVTQFGSTSEPATSYKELSVKTPPTKTTYNYGESLDLTGLVLTESEFKIEDDTLISEVDLPYTSNELTFSISHGVALNTVGENIITVTKNGASSTNFTITVTNNTVVDANGYYLVYQTGFEASDGFETSQTYQGNHVRGPADYSWSFEKGDVTTTASAVISGAQSAHARLYKSDTYVKNEISTDFAISNLARIRFNYRLTDTSLTQMVVSYSTDGSTFKNPQIYRNSSGFDIDYLLDSGLPVSNAYLKFTLELASAPPTSGTPQFSLDDVRFYSRETTAVDSVSFEEDSIEINATDTVQLTHTILPNDAIDKRVTYKSLDDTIATVSSSGLVTGVSAGTTNIEIETLDSAKKDSVEIKVIALIAITKVEFTNDEVTVGLGATLPLEYTITPSDAPLNGITFTSEKDEIASVDNNGVVTGVAYGSTTVTISYGNLSDSIIIKIEEIPTLMVITGEYKLVAGKDTQITIGYDCAICSPKVSYKILEGEDVISLSDTGLVKGLKAGVAKVEASTDSGLSATVTIEVSSAPSILSSLPTPVLIGVPVGLVLIIVVVIIVIHLNKKSKSNQY